MHNKQQAFATRLGLATRLKSDNLFTCSTNMLTNMLGTSVHKLNRTNAHTARMCIVHACMVVQTTHAHQLDRARSFFRSRSSLHSCSSFHSHSPFRSRSSFHIIIDMESRSRRCSIFYFSPHIHAHLSMICNRISFVHHGFIFIIY